MSKPHPSLDVALCVCHTMFSQQIFRRKFHVESTLFSLHVISHFPASSEIRLRRLLAVESTFFSEFQLLLVGGKERYLSSNYQGLFPVLFIRILDSSQRHRPLTTEKMRLVFTEQEKYQQNRDSFSPFKQQAGGGKNF